MKVENFYSKRLRIGNPRRLLRLCRQGCVWVCQLLDMLFSLQVKCSRILALCLGNGPRNSRFAL